MNSQQSDKIKKELEEMGATEIIPLPPEQFAEELRASYLGALDIEEHSPFPYHHTPERNAERRQFLIMTTKEILDYNDKSNQIRQAETNDYIQKLENAINNPDSNLTFP